MFTGCVIYYNHEIMIFDIMIISIICVKVQIYFTGKYKIIGKTNIVKKCCRVFLKIVLYDKKNEINVTK